MGFEEGMIHGIIGRNGSGKTVLMKMILGILQPTTGTAIVGDKRIGKDVDFPESAGAIIEDIRILCDQVYRIDAGVVMREVE